MGWVCTSIFWKSSNNIFFSVIQLNSKASNVVWEQFLNKWYLNIDSRLFIFYILSWGNLTSYICRFSPHFIQSVKYICVSLSNNNVFHLGIWELCFLFLPLHQSRQELNFSFYKESVWTWSYYHKWHLFVRLLAYYSSLSFGVIHNCILIA